MQPLPPSLATSTASGRVPQPIESTAGATCTRVIAAAEPDKFLSSLKYIDGHTNILHFALSTVKCDI